ncbi:MAG TPA: hypothetical protein VM734_30400 [Kofleriaceae bacterium]|nr:hypothetical protein [Kofleriaceae bacterium]
MTEHGIVDQPRDPADGTFVSSTDAPGWMELKVGDGRLFVPQAPRAPDPSLYHFGRADLQFPTTATPVAVELSGLGPWQDGDSLQLVSPNVGLAIAGVETHFATPGAGATTIRGQALDWKHAFSPLIDRARGDTTTWVAQMSNRRADAGSYYSVLTRAGVAADFTVSDGRASTLTATLAPVAQDRTLDLHWRGSEFAAMASQAGPGTRPAGAPALSIRALPDALARNNSYFESLYLYLPSLVDVGPVRGSDDLDQPLVYGNPFTTKGVRWTELVTMVYPMPVVIAGVGTTHAMMISATPVDALAGAGGVLAPAISPVRNVKVDGRSVEVAQAGVGSSPMITWDAPAVGTATGYAVAVHAIERAGGGMRLATLARFNTRTTSLALPAAVVTSASAYVLTITAISSPGADLTAKPFVGSLPYASTDYVTAPISP